MTLTLRGETGLIELSYARLQRYWAVRLWHAAWVVLGPAAVVAERSFAQAIDPFIDQAAQRGVNYVVRPYDSATGVFYFGFGCAIADLNSNGHQDLFILGRADGRAGVFQNDGTGHFIDRSIQSGIPIMQRPSGVAIADFNGDGLLDVYITQDRTTALSSLSEPNVLLRNDGDFTFTNVGAAAGVDNRGRGQGAAWGDFDNDGWLDLYLTNWTSPGQTGQFVNHFYRNLGDETFSSVGPMLGVDDGGLGFVAVWTDINRNGRLDLYLVNDKGHAYTPNRLWRNDGGTFTNISASSNMEVGLFGMGAACGDINGTGYPDIYVSNIPAPDAYGGKNPLFINQGNETFTEQSAAWGVSHFTYSWSTIFFDFTNDGQLDLYVSNMYETNTLYANNGAMSFLNATEAAAVGGVEAARSFNAAVGDVTGNGALDMLVNDQDLFGGPGLPVRLYINQDGLKRNWIRFKMIGQPPNHWAVGGNVEVTAGRKKQWREVYAGGNNFKAQNELIFHFGLGTTAAVETIIATWPGGHPVRTLTNYPVNTLWTLYPPERLGDANNDGIIGVPDLLALLGAWGPVKPGSEIMDLNGDGIIGVADLLALLSKWGG